MSRIVVVGGSGRTGKLVVKQLVANGDTVAATIRSAKHMAALLKLEVEPIMLDLDSSPGPEFAKGFAGADAVVFAAGSADNEASTIDRKGVLKTVRAAEKAKVKRYIAISSLGASTPVPKEFMTAEMKPYFAAKKAANKYVRESELAWTIIEPGELTDGKAAGKITLGENGVANKKVSRADVAAVVVAVLNEPGTAGRTFQIVGGMTAIATAIKAALKG